METLQELVELWKRGSGALSPGFLAFTILHRLGRLRRVVKSAEMYGEILKNKRSSMAGSIPRAIREIRIGEELLHSDHRVPRVALASMDSSHVLRQIEDCTDENWVLSLFSGRDLEDDALLRSEARFARCSEEFQRFFRRAKWFAQCSNTKSKEKKEWRI